MIETPDEPPRNPVKLLLKKGRGAFRRRVIPLAAGELVSRLSGFAILVVISRQFGIDALGVINLGVVLHQHAVTLSDLGVRSIATRLVAASQIQADDVLRKVLLRRLSLWLPAFLLVAAYVVAQPAGRDKDPLLMFAASSLFVCISLDWMLWGRERFWALALWRMIAPVAMLLGVLAAYVFGGGPLTIAAAHAIGTIWGAAYSWRASGFRPAVAAAAVGPVAALRWSEISVLGMAVLANQLFQTGDVLLVGLLATESELGAYSAASRLVFLVFGAYYILTQALYPWFAKRSAAGELNKGMLLRTLAAAALFGTLLATGLAVVSTPILDIVFGAAVSRSSASAAMQILVWVLPMEFVMATWGTFFAAAGRSRWLLLVAGSGAVANVCSNVILVPAHGAVGAAVSAIIGYVVVQLLIALSFFASSKDWIGRNAHG